MGSADEPSACPQWMEWKLWTIGALPGKGKTALSVQSVLTSEMQKVPTMVFSIEMSDLEISKLFLAAGSEFSVYRLRNPEMIGKDNFVYRNSFVG